MPQRTTAGKKNRRSPYAFIGLMALALLGLMLCSIAAINIWAEYEKEAAITPMPSPVPTATVSSVLVTPDPGFSTYTPVPTATPSVLKVGSRGQMVEDLQKRLQELGFYDGKIDGDYGSGTRTAVTAFQRQHGLTADGLAGSQTLSLLYSDRARYIVITPAPTLFNTIGGDVPMLVNRQNALPDDFVPADLVRVKDIAGDTFSVYSDSNVKGVREAVEALTRMINDAIADGYEPWKLAEGYRTIKYQKQIFDKQVNQYMDERNMSRSQAISATRLTVADPGQSEHHTGLAFDLNVPGYFFGDTAQYLWILENCWDYGFILRYTDEKQDITGFMGEEWHVRYVGVEHSKNMQLLDMCLEEYLEYLKKQ